MHKRKLGNSGLEGNRRPAEVRMERPEFTLIIDTAEFRTISTAFLLASKFYSLANHNLGCVPTIKGRFIVCLGRRARSSCVLVAKSRISIMDFLTATTSRT